MGRLAFLNTYGEYIFLTDLGLLEKIFFVLSISDNTNLTT